MGGQVRHRETLGLHGDACEPARCAHNVQDERASRSRSGARDRSLRCDRANARALAGTKPFPSMIIPLGRCARDGAERHDHIDISLIII